MRSHLDLLARDTWPTRYLIPTSNHDSIRYAAQHPFLQRPHCTALPEAGVMVPPFRCSSFHLPNCLASSQTNHLETGGAFSSYLQFPDGMTTSFGRVLPICLFASWSTIGDDRTLHGNLCVWAWYNASLPNNFFGTRVTMHVRSAHSCKKRVTFGVLIPGQSSFHEMRAARSTGLGTICAPHVL